MRVKAYAVALENIRVNRARPVAPAAMVRSPKDPGVSAAAVDKIPFTATAMVTVDAPAVLSMYRSNTVPCVAPSSAPSKVPVGRVIVVAEAEVEVMYPVATSAAVAVAVALIAEVVAWGNFACTSNVASHVTSKRSDKTVIRRNWARKGR